MTTNPVVLGVGGHQPVALQFAAEAALARRAELHVVHCIEPVIAGEIALPVDDDRQSTASAILGQAEAFINALTPRPATTYEVISGAVVGILEKSAEEASLLVVGTDESGWVDRLFGDHVTGSLATHAPGPVAIVPESHQAHRKGGHGVFVAVDGRGPAVGPLRFAFTEASRQREKKLTIVHALRAHSSIDEINAVLAEVSEILAGWSEEFPDVQVTRMLVFDKSEQGCLYATAAASLFVLGRATHRGARGLFGHPVIAEITRHTRCPSVVVPNDWQGD